MKPKTKQIPMELYDRLKDVAAFDIVKEAPDRAEPMLDEIRRLMIDHLVSKAT